MDVFELTRTLAQADGLVTSEGTVYPLLARLRQDGLVETSKHFVAGKLQLRVLRTEAFSSAAGFGSFTEFQIRKSDGERVNARMGFSGESGYSG